MLNTENGPWAKIHYYFNIVTFLSRIRSYCRKNVHCCLWLLVNFLYYLLRLCLCIFLCRYLIFLLTLIIYWFLLLGFGRGYCRTSRFRLLFFFLGMMRMMVMGIRFEELLHSLGLKELLTSIFKSIGFFIIKEHVHHIFRFEDISLESISSIHCTLDCLLLLCSLHNLFFYCSLSDNSINWNLLSLTNSVCSVSCLCIHCRIPIIVIENYSICTSQVNS